MHKSLLVVDWDYFFPNPIEGARLKKDHSYGMYDWGHYESTLMIEHIWYSRAFPFIQRDLDLPGVNTRWKKFAERFNLSEDASVLVADSNAHSGDLLDIDGDPFSDVWLFDNHHDSGYKQKTWAEWLAKARTEEGGFQYSCEDWMLIHYMQGAQLHWRWPTWNRSSHRSNWPKGVEVDAKVDDLKPMDEEFDTLFICRSGAWVPPWEDDKFIDFVGTWDRDTEQVDEVKLNRHFDLALATLQGEMIKRQISEMQTIQ